MPKRNKPTQADLDLFHEAMKGVKPLDHTPRVAKPTPKISKKPPQDHEQKAVFDLGENEWLDPVEGDAFLSYHKSGIDHKTLRKLHKGQYNVEATLDLHGMTVAKASVAVDHFLQTCLRKSIRMVLIIHGKGHHSQVPILKNKLNHWLRDIKIVLAFCSAAPKHGGRGATYVLLKRIEIEEEKWA